MTESITREANAFLKKAQDAIKKIAIHKAKQKAQNNRTRQKAVIQPKNHSRLNNEPKASCSKPQFAKVQKIRD